MKYRILDNLSDYSTIRSSYKLVRCTCLYFQIKLIATIVILTLLSSAAATVAAVLLRRRRTHHHLPLQKQNHPRTDSLRLVPPNTTPSDAKAAASVSKNPPPPLAPPAPVLRNQPGNSTSAEFLYLGTIGSINNDDHRDGTILDAKGTSKGSKGTTYERLGSPELRPLPPLPRHILDKGMGDYELGLEEEDEVHDEEFFSPRGSSGDHKDVMNSPQEFEGACSLNSGRVHSEKFEGEFDVKVKNVDYRSKSSNCYAYDSNSNSNSSSCSPSLMMNLNSPMSLLSKSPDSLVNFPAPPRYIPPPAPPLRAFRPLSPPSSEEDESRDSPSRGSDISLQNFGSPMSKNTKLPPPLPPLPPSAGFLGRPAVGLGPPEFIVPSRPVVGKNLSGERKAEESLMMKPKLKTLHWDKVRASSDRSMVWDQLRASSFEVNEEMIETLFMVNSSNVNFKDGNWKSAAGGPNQDNRVLDPKKSQNIAILLKALNVTTNEVCEALLEGTIQFCPIF